MADKNACAFQYLRLDLWVFSDDAEEAVRFVGNSSREINSSAQREKIPQTIELEWRSIEAHESFYEIAADRIVIVDESVPEVTDPKVGAFHESKSPWGIEVSI
jgi:hypothetical protein